MLDIWASKSLVPSEQWAESYDCRKAWSSLDHSGTAQAAWNWECIRASGESVAEITNIEMSLLTFQENCKYICPSILYSIHVHMLYLARNVLSIKLGILSIFFVWGTTKFQILLRIYTIYFSKLFVFCSFSSAFDKLTFCYCFALVQSEMLKLGQPAL